MNEALNIYWEKDAVGRLWLNEKRDFTFQYSPEWLANPRALPLSIRLPLRQKPFPDELCRTFFSNLLPEAGVRTLIARKLGISETNDFELLKALGGECAGAISLWPEDRKASEKGVYEPISAEELDQMIEKMADAPLLICRDELHLSLAGAQQKLPVFIEEGKIYLPRGGLPSSHVLKPPIPGFEHIVENELFCMALAKKYGLPVPEAGIWKSSQPVYLVERYDRRKNEQGKLVRIHQEDFCQALGFGYSQKYESEGGPNLQRCFSLLSEHGTQPAVDKKTLLQWIIFNFLIGNCDAHAKNVSMLITKEEYKLAPLYDLLSTRAYPKLSPKLAMRIGGQYRPEWVLKEHWERLAKDAEVGFKAVAGICEDMCGKLPQLAAQLAKEYPASKILDRILASITSLAEKSLKSLKGSDF